MYPQNTATENHTHQVKFTCACVGFRVLSAGGEDLGSWGRGTCPVLLPSCPHLPKEEKEIN